MTKPHTTLSEAVRAMNRAKLLPIWDNYAPDKLHVELDVIFKALDALVEQHEAQEPVRHPDDLAVDRFAVAMKAKMAASRAKGRGGWDDESQCTMGTLAKMLVEHMAKGDPIDIAIFAMMLHQREAAAMEHHPCYGGAAAKAIKVYAQPTLAATQAGDAKDAARWRFMMAVADNDHGPEAMMLEELGNKITADDKSESTGMERLVDAAIAAMAPTITRSE